jgi:hypothetical protein
METKGASFGSIIVGVPKGALTMEMPYLLAEIEGPGRRTKRHSSVHKIDIGTRVRHDQGSTLISPVGALMLRQK